VTGWPLARWCQIVVVSASRQLVMRVLIRFSAPAGRDRLGAQRHRACNYLIWRAVVYAVWWIYVLLIDHAGPGNFVPVNTADNWLHLVLASAMIGLGVLLGRRTVGAR
jgi:hypothetical protein